MRTLGRSYGGHPANRHLFKLSHLALLGFKRVHIGHSCALCYFMLGTKYLLISHTRNLENHMLPHGVLLNWILSSELHIYGLLIDVFLKAFLTIWVPSLFISSSVSFCIICRLWSQRYRPKLSSQNRFQDQQWRWRWGEGEMLTFGLMWKRRSRIQSCWISVKWGRENKLAGNQVYLALNLTE